ncbi:hypothetical protein SAMN05216184_11864 [Georgenia satyanarayanai]|uniref:Uncharacterized protein n=1 Tax=Georgenia satyanarayanai TaxID=860221 RepID=A0A2Y9AQ39_9MICO|nr:hypothetical protein [Georgenia satyanarayanai]PYF96771.1 hypothetical protein A8987_11864 [Georgenia satyanarayanai]SSA46514.1 hypothetical protein SAMN05216184_11864 [Georgenia satyanarayanai]
MISTKRHHMVTAVSVGLLLGGWAVSDPPVPASGPSEAAAPATCGVVPETGSAASTGDRYPRSIALGPLFHWAE